MPPWRPRWIRWRCIVSAGGLDRSRNIGRELFSSILLSGVPEPLAAKFLALASVVSDDALTSRKKGPSAFRSEVAFLNIWHLFTLYAMRRLDADPERPVLRNGPDTERLSEGGQGGNNDKGGLPRAHGRVS